MIEASASFLPFPPEQLGRWLVQRQFIWQQKLLTPEQLARFAEDRAVRFRKQDIILLWQLAILHADLVISATPLNQPGLVEVGREVEAEFIYADAQTQQQRPLGWYDAAFDTEELPATIRLLFHPFRYYLLYHIHRVLQLNIAHTQLFWGRHYPKLLELSIDMLQNWSASLGSIEQVVYWNTLVDLAVATEPCKHAQITGWESRDTRISKESFTRTKDEHWQEIASVYRQIGVERIRKLQHDLCVDAELLEPNRQVQTLLRLTSNDLRRNLKGHLGGSMLILMMAELLRRAAEDALDTKLPEEDEQGLGWTVPGIKQKLYGTPRLLDSNRHATDEFLRDLRLDHGVRVRWYVEGDTEFAALQAALEHFPTSRVQLINLRGRVVEKKALSFRDNLVNDNRERLFSFISFDGDRSDNLRVVQAAAKDDLFCGRFYVAYPDFELHNFTVDELAEVLWQIAEEEGAGSEDREILHQSLKGATTGKAVLQIVERTLPQLYQVSKGERWGRYLSAYAGQHPDLPSGQVRPFVKALRDALFAQGADYVFSRRDYRVDPVTGESIRRQPETPDQNNG